ncbi:MAG: hypothetical protein AABZ47_16675 [Planctomycetota bacterium]
MDDHMHSAHHRVVEAGRKFRDPLFLVTALYVTTGLVVGSVGIIKENFLTTFLGFFFITGALFGAFLFHAMSRLAVKLTTMTDAIEKLSDRIRRIETQSAINGTADTSATIQENRSAAKVLDLSSFGVGDPKRLAAATLDRTRFPRLVAGMEDETAPEIAGPTELPSTQSTPSPEQWTDDIAGSDTRVGSESVAHKNLERLWKLARRDGNLAACRSVYSVLLDTLDEQALETYERELNEVGDRVERSLRTSFARHVREQDYDAAVSVGRQLAELFPEAAVTEEFRRIEPLLLRRIKSPPERGGNGSTVSHQTDPSFSTP